MTIEILKIIEISLLVVFGIFMHEIVIDLMELPNVIIPYAKMTSIIGTIIMIGCSLWSFI
jgi:hypothetical protein